MSFFSFQTNIINAKLFFSFELIIRDVLLKKFKITLDDLILYKKGFYRDCF